MRRAPARRLPQSLVYVGLLLGGALLLAAVSGYIQYRQDQSAARIVAEQIMLGSMQAGKVAILRYGCGGCHEIKGIAEASGQVGPPLTGIGQRAELAGRLPNRPDAMIRWIRFPQSIVPGNGMPDLGVSERDARDMAAYLYAQREATGG